MNRGVQLQRFLITSRVRREKSSAADVLSAGLMTALY